MEEKKRYRLELASRLLNWAEELRHGSILGDAEVARQIAADPDVLTEGGQALAILDVMIGHVPLDGQEWEIRARAKGVDGGIELNPKVQLHAIQEDGNPFAFRGPYEQGVRDGAMDVFGEWRDALVEFGGFDEDAEITPRRVAEEVGELRETIVDLCLRFGLDPAVVRKREISLKELIGRLNGSTVERDPVEKGPDVDLAVALSECDNDDRGFVHVPMTLALDILSHLCPKLTIVFKTVEEPESRDPVRSGWVECDAPVPDPEWWAIEWGQSRPEDPYLLAQGVRKRPGEPPIYMRREFLRDEIAALPEVVERKMNLEADRILADFRSGIEEGRGAVREGPIGLDREG